MLGSAAQCACPGLPRAWGTLSDRLHSTQVLHLLGPKTEADLEKKPKVMQKGCVVIPEWLQLPSQDSAIAGGWAGLERGVCTVGAQAAVLVPIGCQGPASPSGEAEGAGDGEW